MRRLNQLPLAFRWQGQLFFQPVQLHLALSDLLVELCLEGLLVALPLVTAYRENVGQLLLETMFPMGNLRRMHPIGTGEFVDRFGYALKAGQLTYDCRYSTMHGMPVTGGRGFRSLKPLWYNGVPP